MAINVTPTYQSVDNVTAGVGSGYGLRTAVLAATGLTAGSANTVPHGLPATPVQVLYVPTNGTATWYETSAPDATNVYITVAASGPTAFKIYVQY